MRCLAIVVASFGFTLLLGGGAPAQQLSRFVNNETGDNLNDGLTGATPWRSITYALSQVTLTPTENMILNIAGQPERTSATRSRALATSTGTDSATSCSPGSGPPSREAR